VADNRDACVSALRDAQIPVAIHYPRPLHLQPAYVSEHFPPGSMPNAEYEADHVLSLPMHPYLTQQEQAQVCDVLKTAAGGTGARATRPN
jgi:UDP-2-acetamido-2-deoxy-ribo-hexuluronate aminotransferase